MNTPATSLSPTPPPTSESPKRVYSAPRLTVHGTLAELTLANPPNALLTSGPIGG